MVPPHQKNEHTLNLLIPAIKRQSKQLSSAQIKWHNLETRRVLDSVWAGQLIWTGWVGFGVESYCTIKARLAGCWRWIVKFSLFINYSLRSKKSVIDLVQTSYKVSTKSISIRPIKPPPPKRRMGCTGVENLASQIQILISASQSFIRRT
jgi:hypothetical protein